MSKPANSDPRSKAKVSTSPCEVITIVSGKGGTGKSFLAASLAYALRAAEFRVLLVDTDMATQGLSLFVLGQGGLGGRSRLKTESSLYHVVEGTNGGTLQLPVPMMADRRGDHGVQYPLIVSNKQFYDRRLALGASSDEAAGRQLLHESMALAHDDFRAAYRKVLSGFLDDFRENNVYDYIIVDTRGGFGELSLVPAVFADSILVVAEPDFTSFNQLAKLLTNIDLMALQESRAPYIRGVIVNKAVDGEETVFRNALNQQFGIELGLSWPIPLDTSVIAAYKSQQIPFKVAPGIPFSEATLQTFTDIFDLVTAEWPENSKTKWRELLQKIKEDNQARIAEEEEARVQPMREIEARAKAANAELATTKEKLREFDLEAEKQELRVRALTQQTELAQMESVRRAEEVSRRLLAQRTWLIIAVAVAVMSAIAVVILFVNNQNLNDEIQFLNMQISNLNEQIKALSGQ